MSLGFGIRIKHRFYGLCSIKSRDAGSDLLLGFNGNRKGSGVARRVIGDHQRYSQFVESLPVIGKQISPRPCLAMKFMASGVTFSAATGQIAFVFARLIINDNDELACLYIFNCLGNASSASIPPTNPYSLRNSMLRPCLLCSPKIFHIFSYDVHLQIDYVPSSAFCLTSCFP